MRRHNYFHLTSIYLGVFVAAFVFTFLSKNVVEDTAEAASAANFRPGNIISDYMMGNYTSMTEADIQAFLTSKNSCNNTDYNYYKSLSNGSKYSWHWDNDHFVCLSEERFGDGETIGSGDTAAHIIWQAAQDYRINPQALIVLLQKETGLITDPIPNNGDYRKATGYGCPDGAPCSAEYYGFKNQIRNAAKLFRTVLDGGWTNFPLGNNYIQYNPNADCGGSTVYIENLATSALYRYTPYQPNPGALAAGYGTATCGAYGNRNFYLYFMDYFGDPTVSVQIKYPSLEEVLASNRKQTEKTDLAVHYNAHSQNYGWMGNTTKNEIAGTTGYSLRLEAIQVSLDSYSDGNIEYRTHVQDIGWQGWVKNGKTSGTTGESLRLEAFEIRLTDKLAKNYDVYYRAHVQDIGWQGWVKNGELAGTTGQSKRIEAIQIKIVKKVFTNIQYHTHVQDIGWQGWVKNGELAGTTGQSKRLEAIEIKLPQELASQYNIQYRVHVQDIGWQGWVKNGELAGTTGQSKRLEAIEIKLPQELASQYNIQYRVHVQDIGWQGWVKNGELAGTTGQSKRLEAIEIKLQRR